MTEHYDSGRTAAGDGADPDCALGQELLARCEPLIESMPQWAYLTGPRGLPAAAIRYCSADLRAINPPIPGFDRLAYGIVSLLRDRTGAITGLAVEACGIAGERVLDAAGRTLRRTFCLAPHGVRDALFCVPAIGPAPLVCYVTEGRLAKAVAIAAIFDDPAVYGWGARNCLGGCLPPEPTVIVIEDARPADEAAAAAHDQAMERGCDRLVAGGRIVLRAGGPPCGCCKDIDQALGRHTLDDLRAWIASAEPYELSLVGHARRCAEIKDPIRRAEAIAKVIADLGLRKRPGMVSAFREAVAAHAAERSEANAEAETLAVEDVRPWPEPVVGADVLDAVVAAIRRHVSLSAESADAAALWIAHSHALDRAWFNPRLGICSPVKRCGKSTLVEVLAGVVPRVVRSSNMTASVIFRMIELVRPTIVIDEADTFMPKDDDLRSVMNSGHTRTTAFVHRNIKVN